jgi:hypothetical protein
MKTIMLTPQAKFRHFEGIDAAKFDELWELQQGEVSALARKLLAASRVIHEQQLGWAWRAPDEHVSAGLFAAWIPRGVVFAHSAAPCCGEAREAARGLQSARCRTEATLQIGEVELSAWHIRHPSPV